MLSVIVPVYQAENTLERCVASIIAQDIDDMEIILVDDGSTDCSGELCDELSCKYENIVVKHINNSGPYQARRQGTLIAHGDVITFVDADDWIEEGAYSDLLGIYRKYNVDILLFSQKVGENGDVNLHFHNDGYYVRTEIRKEIIPTMMWNLKTGSSMIEPSVCSKFIKREIFLSVTNDVTEKFVWGDDAAVTYPMIILADSIYIYNATYYHYFINKNSTTRNRNYPLSRVEDIKVLRSILQRKLSKYSEVNFQWQIDCYIRRFWDMLSIGWFNCHRSSQMYNFPFKLIKPNSKIKLYGAGEVGKSFFQTILQTEYVNLTGWFDKNANAIDDYCGERILGLDELSLDDDEYILIAVSNKKISDDIRNDLISRGIPNEKILWEKTVIIS